MRTNKLMLGLVIAGATVGCQQAAAVKGPGSRTTMREYAGAISVVFSNATTDKMCNLQMSFEDTDKFGDNWLPAAGLAPGKSIEFKVAPGTYKATWNTCKAGDKPFFAATLIGEHAFQIKEDAQLFAYVASAVAPTKRANLVDFHAMVKFQGQEIDWNQDRVKAKAVPDTIAQEPTEQETVAEQPAEPVKPTFDESYIDSPKATGNKTKTAKTAAKTKKPLFKPTLSRDHDITRAAVRMKSR